MKARARKIRAHEAQIAFETLAIEGGLLSPEWLSKVAQLAAGSQGEADYQVPKGLNLRDEIGRYWRIALAHWRGADGAGRMGNGQRGDPGRNRVSALWIGPMLQEAFGFGTLVEVEPPILKDRRYPIGHAALGGHVPVVIAPAGCGIDALSPALGDDGRRRSAFGLAQEYLNAAEGAVWGIATDGDTLRILRDNASLTRPAWIEADLARIFTEERYADFAALWLLLHETRFGREGQPATECALESWREAGRKEGTRAREHLRKGVEEALTALGQGFLSHPDNQALRSALQDGSLSTRDYFSQLLRLIYRLIFLLTVEERNLLHPQQVSGDSSVVNGEQPPPTTHHSPLTTHYSPITIYAEGYSLRRLCDRSVKRSAHDRFSDLWDSAKVVLRGLAAGEPRLGLPALAGIFARNQCPALDAARLENRALLLALFKLAWLREDGALARVNWRDMGPEELGSVYESLLELVPQANVERRQFGFATGDETKGNARKTTGSYYTPDSLVQVLLDSALEPVIADRLAEAGRMASREWRMVEEPFRSHFAGHAHQRRSGPRGVEAGTLLGQGDLPADPPLSEGGTLRDDFPDATRRHLDPSQHRGGLGTARHGGVHSVPEDLPWQSDRTRNAPDDLLRHRPVHGDGNPTIASGTDDPRQATRELGTIPRPPIHTPHLTPEALENAWRSTPFAIRHSLFATQALLGLSIVDPACGSGHFLLAAARRLAAHVARLQANGTPSAAEYRHALRQVVGKCIHGVDLNPMAVELCKVSLWMEAVEPGLPLTFLNSHIQHGNALLGTTPELMAKGIPDAAWDPIEGDDRKVASALKKRNKQGATGQRGFDTLWSSPADTGTQAVTQAVHELEAASDADAAELARKEAKWEGILTSSEYRQQKFVADAWCAAFVWPKQSGPLAEVAPTNELWRQLRDAQGRPPELTQKTVEELARQYRFFHWHLQYPQVFAKGGFDVVLGNPPWDTLSPDQREFFSKWVSGLRSMSPEEQQKLIDRLLADPAISGQWAVHCRDLFALVHFLKESGVFTLYAPGNLGKGDFNIYRMFVETALRKVRINGFAAMVVPGGIYAGANASAIRKFMLDECELQNLFGLSNTTRGWFEKVDVSRFAAFAVRRGGRTNRFFVQFGLLSREDLAKPAVEIDADVIRGQDPRTYVVPEVRDSIAMVLSSKLKARFPAFGDQPSGHPYRHYLRELDMGANRDLFTQDGDGIPLYEGRMVGQFDHRQKSYVSGHGNGSVWQERLFGDPGKAIVPQRRVLPENIPNRVGDRVNRYRIGFRDVAQPRDERSLIATLIPPNCVCGDKVPTITSIP